MGEYKQSSRLSLTKQNFRAPENKEVLLVVRLEEGCSEQTNIKLRYKFCALPPQLVGAF